MPSFSQNNSRVHCMCITSREIVSYNKNISCSYSQIHIHHSGQMKHHMLFECDKYSSIDYECAAIMLAVKAYFLPALIWYFKLGSNCGNVNLSYDHLYNWLFRILTLHGCMVTYRYGTPRVTIARLAVKMGSINTFRTEQNCHQFIWQHIQMQYLDWKLPSLHSNFTDVYS